MNDTGKIIVVDIFRVKKYKNWNLQNFLIEWKLDFTYFFTFYVLYIRNDI